MTETDKAYLAGIIDGEGTIGINKSSRWYQFRIMVYNDNVELMDWIQLRCGGKISSRDRHGRGVLSYEWKLYGISAIQLVSYLIPYIVIKKDQADVAQQWFKTMSGGINPSVRLTDTEKEERMRLYYLMKSYNKGRQ